MRNGRSAEARESLRSTLASMRTSWIDGIAAGRDRKAGVLPIEDGPHSALDAVQLGLVDRVGYEREARDAALAKAGVENRVRYFGGARQESGGMAWVEEDLARFTSTNRLAAEFPPLCRQYSWENSSSRNSHPRREAGKP